MIRATHRWPVSVRVTILYAVVSGLWIFFSDNLLAFFVRDPLMVAQVSIIKGWAYVLVVATLLYFMVRRDVHRIELTQLTIDKSADSVLWVDEEGSILYANHAAGRLLEFDGPLTGLKVHTFDEGLAAEWNLLWRRLALEKSLRLDREYRTARGIPVPVQMTADLIEGQGRPFACVYIRNVTTERRVEEQLRQAQRMDSVGTLAAGVAHDFNNVLTVISGCSDLVVQARHEPDTVRDLAGQIQAAVKKASQLVQSLLNFGRPQPVTLQSLDLAAHFDGQREFLGRLMGPGVTIAARWDSTPFPADADAARWGQVLLNLAANARDAMEGQGVWSVHGRRLEAGLEVSFQDSGPGVPSSLRERIFDPFFTTKEPGKGTGLGLATVYGIVKQHHGSIRVEDAPGGGALFVITLPARG